MGAAGTRPNELSSNPAANRKVPEVLVLGLGNTRLSDDGIGVLVVRHLARDPETPPGLRAVDAGAFGFRFTSKLRRSQAILIVNVAEIGAPAGTTRLLGREELDEDIESGGRIVARDSGLKELLVLARRQGYQPKRLALLAVQPESLDWGEELSPPVYKSLPMVCEQVVETVLAWQHGAEPISNFKSLKGFSRNTDAWDSGAGYFRDLDADREFPDRPAAQEVQAGAGMIEST